MRRKSSLFCRVSLVGFMDYQVFLAICTKISVLYAMIAMGYVAGKFLKFPQAPLSSFVFYLVGPVVMFAGIANVPITAKIVCLPLLVLVISTFISLIVYKLSYLIFEGHFRNILAYSSGSSSTGQFGLPVVLLLFDSETVGIYTVSFIGISLFESTVGFYMAAKGAFSSTECLVRLLRLPSVYAIIFAAILQGLHVKMNFEPLDAFFSYVRSSYIFLGMVCVGISISSIKRFSLNWKFLTVSFIVKYVLWPAIMISIVYIDQHFTYFYAKNVHDALLVVSIVPLSATVVMVASILNYPSEEFSLTVLINIILALLYVPFMITMLSL